MAGDKRISELTELVTPTAFTWVEVLDLDEADPNLQNKKIKSTNLVDGESHVQNTDQFLDQAGANEVYVADVKSASLKKHDQNTDIALATGTGDEVTAFTANLVINTTPMLWWLTGTPASVGQMSIGADAAGERVVQFNYTAYQSVSALDLLLSVASGRYLIISFPAGHWVAEMKTGFVDVGGGVVQVVGITKSISTDFTGFGKLTII